MIEINKTKMSCKFNLYDIMMYYKYVSFEISFLAKFSAAVYTLKLCINTTLVLLMFTQV